MASGAQGDGLRSWAPSQFSSVAEVLETPALGLPRGTEGGLRSLGKDRELPGDRSKSNSKAKVKGGWLVTGYSAPGSKAIDASAMLPKTYSTQILRGTGRACAQRRSELQPQTANNWNHLMPTQGGWLNKQWRVFPCSHRKLSERLFHPQASTQTLNLHSETPTISMQRKILT